MDNQEIKDLRREFKTLEKKISEAGRIVIYRHVSPDFDALGSQFGLASWIKDNFPDKTVYTPGDPEKTMMPGLFPYPDEVPDAFYHQEHLAITVDVSNRPRISEDHIALAREVIKIDHHPLPQPEQRFGDFLIVHPDRPAASDLLALFMLSRSRKRILSAKTASYLYCGIVGDTGRFLYQDTDPADLRLAADLLQHGADKDEIYAKMYQTDQRRMDILKYVLNHYAITPKGTCYYVLDEAAEKALSMTADEGNLHINTFRNMKEVRVVVSVAYDAEKKNYRVSLRSSRVHVAPAAVKFGGGGHDYAAGLKIASLEELPALLQACDELESGE